MGLIAGPAQEQWFEAAIISYGLYITSEYWTYLMLAVACHGQLEPDVGKDIFLFILRILMQNTYTENICDEEYDNFVSEDRRINNSGIYSRINSNYVRWGGGCPIKDALVKVAVQKF